MRWGPDHRAIQRCRHWIDGLAAKAIGRRCLDAHAQFWCLGKHAARSTGRHERRQLDRISLAAGAGVKVIQVRHRLLLRAGGLAATRLDLRDLGRLALLRAAAPLPLRGATTRLSGRRPAPRAARGRRLLLLLLLLLLLDRANEHLLGGAVVRRARRAAHALRHERAHTANPTELQELHGCGKSVPIWRGNSVGSDQTHG